MDARVHRVRIQAQCLQPAVLDLTDHRGEQVGFTALGKTDKADDQWAAVLRVCLRQVMVDPGTVRGRQLAIAVRTAFPRVELAVPALDGGGGRWDLQQAVPFGGHWGVDPLIQLALVLPDELVQADRAADGVSGRAEAAAISGHERSPE